jgi:acetyltransferase-like isoleucine patch superfamily enzyme
MEQDIYLHPMALVDDGVKIGARTRVWAFAHVVRGAEIGEDCNICDHTFIEGRVRIGNRVTLKCGVYLWDGILVEDDVFIGPAAVFTNDSRPRSKRYPMVYPKTTLSKGCSIGAGAIILPGIKIGLWAMVGAGAVVTKDVGDYAMVVGIPARRKGWVCVCSTPLSLHAQRTCLCACGKAYQLVNPDLVRELP